MITIAAVPNLSGLADQHGGRGDGSVWAAGVRKWNCMCARLPLLVWPGDWRLLRCSNLNLIRRSLRQCEFLNCVYVFQLGSCCWETCILLMLFLEHLQSTSMWIHVRQKCALYFICFQLLINLLLHKSRLGKMFESCDLFYVVVAWGCLELTSSAWKNILSCHVSHYI